MKAVNWLKFRCRHWRRTVLLRGSPTYRLTVWLSGISFALVWIAISEFSNPGEAKLFVNPKRQRNMSQEEIEEHNKSIVGRLLEDPSCLKLAKQQPMDLESRLLPLYHSLIVEQQKLKIDPFWLTGNVNNRSPYSFLSSSKLLKTALSKKFYPSHLYEVWHRGPVSLPAFAVETVQASSKTDGEISSLNGLNFSPAQEKLASLSDGKDRSGSYVIVQLSGRQHWMEIGRFYDVYRVSQKIGHQIHLHRVLLYQNYNGNILIGRPFLEKVRVAATVLEHFRGHKINVLKHKAKKRYRRLRGHRQEMSRIRITNIEILSNTTSSISNFFSGDPFFSLMRHIQHTELPGGVLKLMKKTALNPVVPEDYEHDLGRDPFNNFDPVLNYCLIRNLLSQ
ncbi:putative 50S ribosomal protein L21 [Cardiosporidium cionae]|uniref:50S ribosomal protein L21 n=1 Tax=Cardiosporidium cionae TaxID=476202 RepID=A0ABQ7JEY0_9APIC|nr:putative 50S ribosomal protein L21 [Cardiosporidium cionae]|eukprot:KAF8822571.1 putative 50S ribosomal protein L21 [Cardiosporidium cionae]